MTLEIEHILDVLEKRSAPGLISPEAFAHIKSAGRLLPTGLSFGLGFETRLADPSPEVDFILRPMAPLGLAIIAGLHTEQQLPPVLSQDAHWVRLRDLCRHWATLGSALNEATLCLWIELDSEQLVQAVPSPSLVFVQLQKSCCSPERYEALAQSLHVSVTGASMPRTLRENFVRCRDRMPERGQMTLLGLPVARQTQAFRIVVGEVDPDQIPEYVSAVGWKGRTSDLESLIFALRGFADRHSINFDVGEQGIGKVGIEFGIAQEYEPTSDPRWETILDFLVKQGWCRREKRDALLAWPKHLTLMTGAPKPMLLRRFISHVKLSLEPKRRVTAKAYVGVAW